MPVYVHHVVLVALVRDDGERHVLHGPVRGHDEHHTRVVLARDVAGVFVNLQQCSEAWPPLASR
jgi:hypothetical protein